MDLKEALTLHEVAGLAGLEVTGKYDISAEYIGLTRPHADLETDFTPECARFETMAYRRVMWRIEAGDASNLEKTEVLIKLLERQHLCGDISREQYCAKSLETRRLFIDLLKYAVRSGMRGRHEITAARDGLAGTQQYCSGHYHCTDLLQP